MVGEDVPNFMESSIVPHLLFNSKSKLNCSLGVASRSNKIESLGKSLLLVSNNEYRMTTAVGGVSSTELANHHAHSAAYSYHAKHC